MKDKLYKMMNWPDIESIVYGEESNPQKTLGRKYLLNTTLFQTFLPDMQKVFLCLENDEKEYEMEMADEEGFYVTAITGKQKGLYRYKAIDKAGKTRVITDPYQFQVTIPNDIKTKWNNGMLYDAYHYLGAHSSVNEGIAGINFCVWAPNAVRVSVVGDFNQWNGKSLPMMKEEETGLFSLFVPELKKNTTYQYEIKIKTGETFRKNDPYSFAVKNGCSAIVENKKKKSEKTKRTSIPRRNVLNILKVGRESFGADNGTYLTYRSLAEKIIPYIKEMKYTHVQFCPLMNESKEKKGQITSFYALDERYGTADELKDFIEQLHKEKIGVVFEWIPAYFNKEKEGLCYFDGTYLYGHMDERMRYNVAHDGFIFNYGRPQVNNYLTANALYWLKEFDIDGIFINGLSSMLYLDYGKPDGEWVANIYGGNENLDAINFIKNLNGILHNEKESLLLLTKETSAWPQVTDAVDKGGLGFDYVWNTGFRDDVLTYMQREYEDRNEQIQELTNNMVYAYCENYVLPLCDEKSQNKENGIVQLFPGDEEEKKANLRILHTFFMCHPGKKMADMDMEEKKDQKLDQMIHSLNNMYMEMPALHSMDRNAEGFEWIQCINHNDGIISFMRKSGYIDETLLIVCNFSKNSYNSYKFGVPLEGKYKEIFLSQDKQFGGDKAVYSRYKETKEEDFDGRKNSLTIRICPLSVSIYQYKPYTEEELLKIAEKKVREIKERLEKEAIRKANALKKMSLKEELEKKIEEADQKIARGEERQKNVKLTKKKN